MKTHLPLSTFVLFALLSACLSSPASGQVSMGIKGGVNLSTLALKPGDNDGYDTRVAPNFALVLRYALSPSFALQAEPGFAQRGARYALQTPSFEVSGIRYSMDIRGTIKSGYIELPLVLQYRLKLKEKLGLIVSGGPELRYLAGPLKSSFTTKAYENNQLVRMEKTENSATASDGVRKLDAGVAAGAGLSYTIGETHLFAEARYHLGLRSITDKIQEDQPKSFNRGSSLMLGVLFPLKGK